MKWIDSPPVADASQVEVTDERIALRGPGALNRLASGATAAVGGIFALQGWKMSRVMPPGLRAFPLAFAAVGAGLSAVGASMALSRYELAVSGEGISIRWKFGPLTERELTIPRAEISKLDATVETRTTGNDDVGYSRTPYWIVAVVRLDGNVQRLFETPFEQQAKDLREKMEKLLNTAP